MHGKASVFTSIILASIVFLSIYYTSIEEHDHIVPESPPRFAYLLQTEQCLPLYLRAKEYFGNQTLCDCDVYVLSYRHECKEDINSQLPHVTHSFNSTVLFSAGRNIAFYKAKNSGGNYLYYIFIDDDITLSYNRYTREDSKRRRLSPLRIFMEFLLEYQPAIAGTDYNVWNQAHQMISQWKTICKGNDTRVIPIYQHDDCLRAYHYKAVDYVLPYAEQYDKLLPWLSAIYVQYRITVAFFGQFVYFPEIIAVNSQHRYKADSKYFYDKKVRRDILEDVRRLAPTHHQTHPVFDFLFNYNFNSDSNTRHILCEPPPKPLDPVIPYKTMYHV